MKRTCKQSKERERYAEITMALKCKYCELSECIGKSQKIYHCSFNPAEYQTQRVIK